MIEEKLNFCRVFEMSDSYPSGYYFYGGISVEFKMVDSFNPIPPEHFKDNEIKEWIDYVPMIKEFLLRKNYVKSNKKYLVLTDFDESFVFKGEK